MVVDWGGDEDPGLGRLLEATTWRGKLRAPQLEKFRERAQVRRGLQLRA